MNKAYLNKKNNNCKVVVYFLTFTVLTTVAVVATILEGNRIKRENELLSYEVW